MAPETSEITTRDVLQQINRRLELIESDVRAVSEKLDVSVQTLRDENAASYRSLNEKWDASFQTLRDENAASDRKREVSFQTLNDKIDASVQVLDAKREASAQTLNDKIDTSVQKLHEKIDTHFRWIIGIVLASWLSTMGAILFKGL